MMPSVYKKEIAHNMGISIDTLRRKLKNANLKVPRGLITPEQQKEIYYKLCYKNIWQDLVYKRGINL